MVALAFLLPCAVCVVMTRERGAHDERRLLKGVTAATLSALLAFVGCLVAWRVVVDRLYAKLPRSLLEPSWKLP